ncbi:MAG: DUF4859 domain-containing protein [Bacteroidaceae bacterium]|nr:DUF4859 domain-containing protein [Bacteroidaceae bacterium]
MKRHIVFISAFMAALFLVACQQEDFTPFGPEQTDYSQAKQGDRIEIVEELEKKDAFETSAFMIPRNSVLSAFGVKKLPEDLAFFGVDKKGNRLCGPRYYTSTSGFYFDKDGFACSSASKDACLFVDFSPSNLKLIVGQVPEACTSGETYTLHMGLTTSAMYCPVDLTLTISAAGDWAVYFKHSDGLTYSVYETVKTDYTSLSVYLDEDAVCNALGLDSFAKLISGMKAAKPSVMFYGLNADGSEYLISAQDGSGTQVGYTANNKGHWFDNNGNVCSWKATGWFCFSEWDGSSNPIFFNIGQATTGVEPGMSTIIRQKFTHGDKEAVITYKVHIVNKITPDLGIDE